MRRTRPQMQAMGSRSTSMDWARGSRGLDGGLWSHEGRVRIAT